jgi:hypothetical protein
MHRQVGTSLESRRKAKGRGYADRRETPTKASYRREIEMLKVVFLYLLNRNRYSSNLGE